MLWDDGGGLHCSVSRPTGSHSVPFLGLDSWFNLFFILEKEHGKFGANPPFKFRCFKDSVPPPVCVSVHAVTSVNIDIRCLYCSLTLLFEAESKPQEVELPYVSLKIPQDPIFIYQLWDCRCMPPHPASSVSALNLNSGSHAHRANALPTEPPPGSSVAFLSALYACGFLQEKTDMLDHFNSVCTHKTWISPTSKVLDFFKLMSLLWFGGSPFYCPNHWKSPCSEGQLLSYIRKISWKTSHVCEHLYVFIHMNIAKKWCMCIVVYVQVCGYMLTDLSKKFWVSVHVCFIHYTFIHFIYIPVYINSRPQCFSNKQGFVLLVW